MLLSQKWVTRHGHGIWIEVVAEEKTIAVGNGRVEREGSVGRLGDCPCGSGDGDVVRVECVGCAFDSVACREEGIEALYEGGVTVEEV